MAEDRSLTLAAGVTLTSNNNDWAVEVVDATFNLAAGAKIRNTAGDGITATGASTVTSSGDIDAKATGIWAYGPEPDQVGGPVAVPGSAQLEVTVNGGTIVAGTDGIYAYGPGSEDTDAQLTVTVNGGSITAKDNGVDIVCSNVIVNGGTITGDLDGDGSGYAIYFWPGEEAQQLTIGQAGNNPISVLQGSPPGPEIAFTDTVPGIVNLHDNKLPLIPVGLYNRSHPAVVGQATTINLGALDTVDADEDGFKFEFNAAATSGLGSPVVSASAASANNNVTFTPTAAGEKFLVFSLFVDTSEGEPSIAETSVPVFNLRIPVTVTGGGSSNPPGSGGYVDPGQGAGEDIAPPAGPGLFKPVDVGAASVLREKNRTATSLLIAAQPEFAQARELVVVDGDSPIDGVSGGPLAIARKVPVVYSGKLDLDPSVLEFVRNKQITKLTLVGKAAVAPTTRARLEQAGVVFEVVQGVDRFDTAAKVAKLIAAPTGYYVASGHSLADAMVAAVAAGQAKGAVLLSDGFNKAAATTAVLEANPTVPVFTVGGPAAAAYKGTALVGVDRFDTANRAAGAYMQDGSPVVVTDGFRLVDAVPGAVLAALRGVPFTYVKPGQNTGQALQALKASTGKTPGAGTYIGY